MQEDFPDLGALSDQALESLIEQSERDRGMETDAEARRILRGKTDILRAEQVNRLRKRGEGGGRSGDRA